MTTISSYQNRKTLTDRLNNYVRKCPTPFTRENNNENKN